MQKIEVHTKYLLPCRLAIVAAALAALIVQTPGVAQVAAGTGPRAAASAAATSDPELTARKTWHAVMRNTPVPGKGCFHASYPEAAWQHVECKEVAPHMRPSVNQAVGPQDVGNGLDYFTGISQGLITSVFGKFFISGVESETNVPTASTPAGSNPPLGSNAYTLQINTKVPATSSSEGAKDCLNAFAPGVFSTPWTTTIHTGLPAQRMRVRPIADHLYLHSAEDLLALLEGQPDLLRSQVGDRASNRADLVGDRRVTIW